jgi:hypothetical protein
MRVLDHGRWFEQHPVLLVNLAVTVQVIGLAVAVSIHLPRGQNVRFPRPNPIRIGLDLGESILRQQVLVCPLVPDDREIVGPIVRRGEYDVAVLVDVVRVDELNKTHIGVLA